MQITILDYGVGNLYSLRKALERRNVQPQVSKELPEKKELQGLILPGVGSFPAAAKKLSTLRQRIIDLADAGTPILGVCLGMQLFFERSEEGQGKGLSLIPGEVVKLPTSVKTPHMGWNTLQRVKKSPVTEEVEDGSWVYFVHSYHPKPKSKRSIVAESSYGVEFPAIVASKNIFGTQFHPEKSGVAGAKLLQNFISYCRS